MTDPADDTLAHLKARQERARDLAARLKDGTLTPAQFNDDVAKLWGAPPGSTPQQILDAMQSYIRRAYPDAADSERVFADALRRLKAKEGDKG